MTPDPDFDARSPMASIAVAFAEPSRVMCLRISLIVTALLVGILHVAALAEISSAPYDCQAIENDQARLRCYDAAAGYQRPSQATIAHWSGLGGKTTPPFHVSGPWQLQWHSDGGAFFVDIRTPAGNLVDSAGGGINNPTGDTYVPHGGDFLLHINTGTSWSVEILALPPPEHDTVVPRENDTQRVPADLIESDDSIQVPPCDGPGVSDLLKKLIGQSPTAQALHVQVVDIGDVSSRKTMTGRLLCSATILTNGGQAQYDFQTFARHGQVFTDGIPVNGKR
jgi:hypothetical protein